MCYNPWGCRVGHDLATEHRQAKLQDIRSIQKSQLYFYILENKQPEVEILKECSMLRGVNLTGPAEQAFAGELDV